MGPLHAMVIVENERVDIESKAGITNGIEYEIRLNYWELLRKYRNLLLESWREYFDKRCKGFAYLIRKENSSNCETCEKPEDVHHMFIECDRNRNERESLMSQLGISAFSAGAFIVILSDPTRDAAKNLCDMVMLTRSVGSTKLLLVLHTNGKEESCEAHIIKKVFNLLRACSVAILVMFWSDLK